MIDDADIASVVHDSGDNCLEPWYITSVVYESDNDCSEPWYDVACRRCGLIDDDDITSLVYGKVSAVAIVTNDDPDIASVVHDSGDNGLEPWCVEPSSDDAACTPHAYTCPRTCLRAYACAHQCFLYPAPWSHWEAEVLEISLCHDNWLASQL